MYEYQRPDTNITLAEGLKEYYASRDDLVTGRGASLEAREFFRCHDAAHVVFGCGTRLPDEVIVKMWSFFGTTAGFSLLRAYRLPESQEIYATIGLRQTLSTAARACTLVPRVLWRCFQMHNRWPWAAFDAHLDRPLHELRREYGIELVEHP